MILNLKKDKLTKVIEHLDAVINLYKKDIISAINKLEIKTKKLIEIELNALNSKEKPFNELLTISAKNSLNQNQNKLNVLDVFDEHIF